MGFGFICIYLICTKPFMSLCFPVLLLETELLNRVVESIGSFKSALHLAERLDDEATKVNENDGRIMFSRIRTALTEATWTKWIVACFH
jgi:hypothetical protein